VSTRQKVAVIGAGAAGLVALRHLSTRLDVFEPVAFEQAGNVGGTWNYTDRTGVDENGLPILSSMYKYLHTNLPKELMAFPDFPFPDGPPSYVSHECVLDYLENYARSFNLLQFIRVRITGEDVELPFLFFTDF
jgi:cation diffusion facilitator CzcD-associated flavoprotein CzcO